MYASKRIGCVIMAAGSAARYGENKLAAEFRGKAVIEYALDAAKIDLFDTVLVVTQYPEIEKLAKNRGYYAVRNEHPDWGISHTIALGTTLLESHDAILFLVADQPLLTSRSVLRVVSAWLSHPEKICGAGCGGKRGNPNIFPAAYFEELKKLRGDCGGNAVIRCHEDAFFLVEIPQAELSDCDTPEALEALKKEQ